MLLHVRTGVCLYFSYVLFCTFQICDQQDMSAMNDLVAGHDDVVVGHDDLVTGHDGMSAFIPWLPAPHSKRTNVIVTM